MNRPMWLDRILIVLAGLTPRLLLGFVFYGSIDTKAYMNLTEAFLNNTLVSRSYVNTGSVTFPVIPLYLWLVSWVSWATGLPPVFCVKILPILFDVMIGVLVYDLVRRLRPSQAFPCGLLYALSPIALITTSIHGQWESLPIFFFLLSLFVRDYFKDSYAKYMFFGMLFVFAFLIKPMSLIFIPFFFVPSELARKTIGKFIWWFSVLIGLKAIPFYVLFKMYKTLTMHQVLMIVGTHIINHMLILVFSLAICLLVGWLSYKKFWPTYSESLKQYFLYQSMSVVGLLTMLIVCFTLFIHYGFSMGVMMDNLLRYFNQGIQVMGLPFAYPFNVYPYVLLFKNRFWLMGIIVFIAWLYYRGRLNITSSIVISLSAVFGLVGGSPQYFVWLVPFLLIGGFYRLAALYNAALCMFFFLYYMNPWSNVTEPYQSMASFAAREEWAWFMPSAWLAQAKMVPWMHFFGNYMVPFMCIGIGGYVLWLSMHKRVENPIQRAPFLWYKSGYLLIGASVMLMIAVLRCCTSSLTLARHFDSAVTSQKLLYHVHVVNGFVAGNYDVNSVFNVISLLVIMAIAWSAYTFFIKRFIDESK